LSFHRTAIRHSRFTMLNAAPLTQLDPEVHSAITAELARQQSHIELIGSENFTYPAVLEAQGSVLTNKYAEGYPGKRWYGGCEQVDKVEQLAIDRAKQLFGADHANVQPHSGAQANTAVYAAVLVPGDKVLGMNLSHGGHLTHGNPANFSGKLYNFCQYGVREDNGLIDYDELAATALREKPKMITVGASAYSRVIDFARMGEIARSVGAMLFADIAHIAGLVAAGVHPSPVPARGFRHDHHPQDPARPARRPDPLPRPIRQGDRLGRFSRNAGRAPHACDRRQGGLPRRVPQARVQGLLGADRAEIRGRWPPPSSAAATRSSRAAPTTTSS
jgi:hypothetical protein